MNRLTKELDRHLSGLLDALALVDRDLWTITDQLSSRIHEGTLLEVKQLREKLNTLHSYLLDNGVADGLTELSEAIFTLLKEDEAKQMGPKLSVLDGGKPEPTESRDA